MEGIMAEDVARMMQNVALALVEDYAGWVEAYRDYSSLAPATPPPMTVQAYIRARILNEIEPATRWAFDYADTNGGV
jgi:hypothetical protein